MPPRPTGIVDGSGCPGQDDTHEIFLAGTEKQAGCAPSSPSPSATPSTGPSLPPVTPIPTAVPTILPTPRSTPTPAPVKSP